MLNTIKKSSLNSKPPRILVYGVQGIGKSTFGADAPSPVFIQTEDGLGNIDVETFPLAKSYEDVMNALTSLATENHKYKTVVIDSLDWFEPLVWARVAQEKGAKSIEDIGYGKGYVMAVDFWREYLEALNYLRDEKDMMIIQTAHSEIKRFDSPENDPYDKYFVKLHKSATGLVQEYSDCVFFANYQVMTKSKDVGFGNEKSRSIGNGDRFLFTAERPAFHAKNRYSLPEKIKFDANVWGVLAQSIPALKQSEKEAA